MTDLKVLILAGGQSTRMGQPKHLLMLGDQPTFVRLLLQIRLACPEAQTYISLRDQSMVSSVKQFIHNVAEDLNVEVVLDQQNDIGPAAGLLAAYQTDSTCRWLVVACDFPLLQAKDVRQLVDAYEDPVTCFQNSEGWTEPLFAIWNDTALRILKDGVETGKTGPNRVIHLLKGKTIRPQREKALFNTNTPEEWEAAKQLI